MTNALSYRGQRWIDALTHGYAAEPGFPDSVRVVDAELSGRKARYLAIVPDPGSRYLRSRQGEVGLEQAWQLARAVREQVHADRNSADKTPIVAVIDVPSQAYGRLEEAYGLHQAIAGAAGAYAEARLAGHAVIGLILGKAIAAAFLAHGYQANRLIAVDDDEVQVHAMGKASAARITLRSVEALDALAEQIPPMAYDIQRYATLGLLWRCVTLSNADQPEPADVDALRGHLRDALADIEQTGRAGRTRGSASDVDQKTDPVRINAISHEAEGRVDMASKLGDTVSGRDVVEKSDLSDRDVTLSKGERSLQPDTAQRVRETMRRQWKTV